MLNTIPESWKYDQTLENLFFFFQCSEELLSFNSPDSFRLPVCNCMTLCSELRRIYRFLHDNKQIDKYYSKYIPCIIDELIKSIHSDFILKRALGLRLETTITGLTSAKDTPQELLKWVNIIQQSCTLEQHTDLYKKCIIQAVQSGNNKKELLLCTQNYYIDLISIGYSPEYLYQSIIRFFNNRETTISSPEDIEIFLSRFDGSYQEYEFYVVADTYKLDNLSRINPHIGKSFDIHELDESTIIEQKKNNGRLRKFYNIFEDLQKRGISNIKMLSCKSEDLDPYSAFNDISRTINLAQCFEGYFKHKEERKIFFDILLVTPSNFTPIKPRRVIPNRPYIDQVLIDRRIETVLNANFCSVPVTISLLRAMDMHLDALNCKNSETMLRTFWTALEALFFTADMDEKKESAKYCLLHIIQKTYLLKQFRFIYEQLTSAIVDSAFWEEMQISSFAQFVEIFMSIKADSPDFRKFTTQLQTNPLLRSRIYWFRKEITDCKSIQEKILEHCEKVSWHIDRIYRTRNLSTHAGISMPYIDEILFNLHNYFDYVVNYTICKLEHGDYIQNLSAMIFEAKNDNLIHLSLLKNNFELTKENYLHALFGPDLNIISYNFEVIVTEDTEE